MRVLLISANTTNVPHPVYPLGLDYIAGALSPRHRVRIFDLNAAGGTTGLEAVLDGEKPEVVGISLRNIDNVDVLATKSFLHEYERIVRLVRSHSEVPIVLGGSGFSIFPTELMALLDADFGVVGEGEYMGLLLENIEKGMDPAGLPGIVTKGGGEADPAPWRGRVHRQLQPPDNRLRHYVERGGIMNLQTKRGCPFRCIYCIYPYIEGRRMRLVSPDEIAGEAWELQTMGARFLFITDSAFNADVGYSLAVAGVFRRRGITIPWGAFFAPTNPPDGYYKTLAEAGLTHVEFGTESLCDSQLRRYRKPFGAEDVFAAHESAREAGLHIAHYFLFGGPGETRQSLDKTMVRMETIGKSVFFLFCGMRILPHTALYDLAVREGQIDPGQNLLSPVFYHPENIGTEEILNRIRKQANGRSNWVYGDGGAETEKAVTRMHARGHTGPLWELLIR